MQMYMSWTAKTPGFCSNPWSNRLNAFCVRQSSVAGAGFVPEPSRIRTLGRNCGRIGNNGIENQTTQTGGKRAHAPHPDSMRRRPRITSSIFSPKTSDLLLPEATKFGCAPFWIDIRLTGLACCRFGRRQVINPTEAHSTEPTHKTTLFDARNPARQ